MILKKNRQTTKSHEKNARGYSILLLQSLEMYKKAVLFYLNKSIMSCPAHYWEVSQTILMSTNNIRFNGE